jgi:hypothetical protein
MQPSASRINTLVSTATSWGFCMGAINKPERLLTEATALFIRKLVAALASLFANSLPINLLGRSFLHIKKLL